MRFFSLSDRVLYMCNLFALRALQSTPSAVTFVHSQTLLRLLASRQY